jgi:hypothetical protein
MKHEFKTSMGWSVVWTTDDKGYILADGVTPFRPIVAAMASDEVIVSYIMSVRKEGPGSAQYRERATREIGGVILRV